MSTEDHCQIMQKLSTSLLLRFTLIFNLATSLIAFPMVIAASIALWKARVAKLFHINVIIIFQVHLIGFFLHCFSRIVLHCLDLYNYAMLDYCDMTPSTIRCFAFRIQYVFGLWLICATTVPLIIERYIATIKSSSYEHMGCSLGIVMALLQVFLAVVPTSINFRNFSFEEPVMNYCMALKPGLVSHTEKAAIVSLCIQIIARILFHYLFKMNENLRRKQLTSSLSNRYSLEQNLKSMKTLKRFADLQSIFMIIHMALFIFILQIGPEVEKSTYISLVEMNAPYPLYAVISIIVLLKKAHLNKVKLKKTLENHVNADQNVYFENFKKFLH
ncbi:hypothetical protein GCK72_019457 [Caenorhabditis remanei]|uniref:Uncharacterized protein n=1 Tax=Caenorhabditis remanei TaxID=31234 RepID=A0A6A5GEI9_CAERE|nr:hypothetical protein GCK72_019457 [Caenorhabditis remanei]KAF1752902.1 hypothetical protein GCK72_019457 [Caenorhabditis remanei]